MAEGKHAMEKGKKEEKQEPKEVKQNNELFEMKKANETLKIQLDETNERLKRVAAEFDNYKKRNEKEKLALYSSVMADVVSNFLPVIDNLEKAVASQTEDENYKQGVELVLKQFKDVLKSKGVEEIETVGTTFNPEYHEAVSSVQDENLGEKEVKETQKIKIGDLTIDLDKFEVKVKDEVIDLTLREFEVLKYLANQPGQVVTREILLEKVWGYEYYGDIRTVDVTVRRIREKIEKDTSAPKILITKRGVGYYLANN